MIALKAIKRSRFKSFLIFLSITIAVMSIFLISSISQGVISMYSSMIQTDGDIIITQKGISDTFFSNVDRDLLEKIESIEEVHSTYAMIVGASPVAQLPIVGIYGTTKNHFSHYKLQKGFYPQEKEVILGTNISTQVQGEFLKIANKIFKVSGVFESGIGFEEGGVVMNIEDASELFNKSSSFIIVSATSPNSIEILKDKLAKLDSQIEVKTTKHFVDEYNQFKIIENSSLLISFLAFVMGLMGVASVMSMIVTSRKQEFGIMRALGKSRYFIMKNLFLETMLLSLSAYTFALVLSIAFLEILPSIEMLQGYVSGTISINIALYVLISSLIMALIGALLPSWIASKTDPVLLINQGCS